MLSTVSNNNFCITYSCNAYMYFQELMVAFNERYQQLLMTDNDCLVFANEKCFP